MNARRFLLLHLPIAAALATSGGCTFPSRRALKVTCPPTITEGERTRITLSVTNVHPEPIIPVSVTLYARSSPAEYFAVRHIVADMDYLHPLQAAEVRYLKSLGRIEADHVRDGDTWRRIPHSRFLHPQILLPGQVFTQDFEFQAYASYGRLLAVDFFYLRLADYRTAQYLYVTSDPLVPPKGVARFTQAYVRISPEQIPTLQVEPARYILYRPHIPNIHSPSILSKSIRLPVQKRSFSYRDAARRARTGARTHGYFAPAGAWVFDYDAGTWFVSPTTTTKLTGHYTDLIVRLDTAGAEALTLTAPRVAADPFLDYLQKAGYSDSNAATPQAHAAIPTHDLVTVLQQAEAMGYTIDGATWRSKPPTP